MACLNFEAALVDFMGYDLGTPTLEQVEAFLLTFPFFFTFALALFAAIPLLKRQKCADTQKTKRA